MRNRGGGADTPDNPWVDDNLDAHDSDDEIEVFRGNTTQPFQPGGSSTPYHGGEEIEMQTHLHEQSGLPETSYAETIFGDITTLEGFIDEDDKKSLVKRAKRFIRNRYPRADFEKLGPIGFGKRPGNKYKIVSFGGEVERRR